MAELPPIPRSTTLKDVAAEASVSIATASYVLNRKRLDRITLATQRRVREAARKLGYRPDSTARSLVTRRSATVGVYLPRPLDIALKRGDRASTFMLRGILQHCTLHDYAVQIAVEGSDLFNFSVDGWIALYAPDSLPFLSQTSRPIVYLDPAFAPKPELREFTVRPDYASAAKLMVKHLGPSAKRIGFLLSTADTSASFGTLDRFRVIRETFADKARVDLLTPPTPSWDPEVAMASLYPMLDAEPYDTFICQTDEFAAFLLKHLHEEGVDVPGKVQVAAFDDTGYRRVCFPSLTTVDQRFEELGYRAAYRLLGRVPGAPKQNDLKMDDAPRPDIYVGASTRS